MKKTRIGLSLLFVAVIISLFFVLERGKTVFSSERDSEKSAFSSETPRSFPVTGNTVKASLGGSDLTLEIADTDEERETGLSHRESLPEGQGLLFVFPRPDTYGFWMKDMHFPIDIIWFDQNMKAVYIQESASSDSYPEIFLPEEKSLYVLEVNAGFTEQNGVHVGDSVSFLKQ